MTHEPGFQFGSFELCQEVAAGIRSAEFVIIDENSIAGRQHDETVTVLDRFLRGGTRTGARRPRRARQGTGRRRTHTARGAGSPARRGRSDEQGNRQQPLAWPCRRSNAISSTSTRRSAHAAGPTPSPMRCATVSTIRRASSRWLFVSEALAFGLQDKHLRPLAVADLAVLVAKGELVAVAANVPAADVMVDARPLRVVAAFWPRRKRHPQWDEVP